ncbi:hypothetical protein BLA29_010278 [Euroglyphus maynei]|uniref:Uncharacterized protein n=1 Tax=Euroglyphus maynei TaxID=6958 RepID=A0A1Y3AME2_EURMA|nr:hypothetical protein BLA29_010278 [Euroglyphus maynei]
MLNRAGNVAFRASIATQTKKSSNRVFIPSAIILTITGFGVSLFGLHRLDDSRKHAFYLNSNKP